MGSFPSNVIIFPSLLARSIFHVSFKKVSLEAHENVFKCSLLSKNHERCSLTKISLEIGA